MDKLKLVKVLDMPAVFSKEEAELPGVRIIEEATDENKPSLHDELTWRISEEKLAIALRTFASTGSVKLACETAGLSRRVILKRRKLDPDFADLWEEAREIAVDALETEARRRAVDGVDEPVFYQGVEVARIRRYSDNLLRVLLQGQIPHRYRNNVDVEFPGGLRVSFAEMAKMAGDADNR